MAPLLRFGASLWISLACLRAGAAQETLYTVAGKADEWFGLSVCRLGDLDGDGLADFAASCPWATRAYSGADGTLLLDLLPALPEPSHGRALCGGGDLDGDGVPDVAVGAPSADTEGIDCGAVWVRSGENGFPLHVWTGAAHSGFGQALAFGDWNGEGLAGLAVGAPGDDAAGLDAGAVFVGSAGGALLHLGTGSVAGEGFGTAVCALTDLDGDGAADLAIGAPGSALAPGAGRVDVVSGANGQLLASHEGGIAGAGLGGSLSAGDLDGDGTLDLAAGGPALGVVQVWSGHDGHVLATHWGVAPFSAFGTAVALSGDLDRDGFADLAVGAPLDGFGSTQLGSVSVWSGRDGAQLFALKAGGMDLLGTSLCCPGDVNGDGFADLVLGAPGQQQLAGAVRVVSGATLPEFQGGTLLAGAIQFAHDGSAARFPGVKGMKLHLDFPAATQPWTGSVWVRGPDAALAGQLKVKLGKGPHKTLKLKASGTHLLRIDHLTGAAPGFAVLTGWSLPKYAKPYDRKLKFPGAGSQELKVLALSGAVLDLTFIPKGGFAGDLTIAAHAPDGSAADLAPWLQVDGDEVRVVAMPLPLTGKWTFTVTASAVSAPGKVNAAVAIEQPPPLPGTLYLP